MQTAPALVRTSFALALSLSGCFYAPTASKGRVSVLDPSARSTQATLMTSTKAVYAIDPQSKSDTLIAAPSGALSGSSITVPTGALAVATDLVFEQAAPIAETSLVSSVGIDTGTTVSPVGSGLVIRPSNEVELLGTLVISLPLNGSASLHLQGKNYAVFYKQFIGGSLQDGVIPGRELRFTDEGTVVFEGFFGAYWLVELSKPVEARVEVKAAEPIVNHQKVAVIDQGGVVAESVVQAKMEKPLVAWDASQISLDAGARRVNLVAKPKNSPRLASCKADFFLSTDASSGELVETGSNTQVSFAITKAEAHSLFGRIRCLDEEGRLTVSPWSSGVEIPALAAVADDSDGNFGDSDLSLPKLRLQTRELLKIVVSSELANAAAGFRIVNSATDAELFSSLAGSQANPRVKRQKLADGREVLSLQMSVLGTLKGYVIGSNVLNVQGPDAQPYADLTVTLRDFTLLDNLGITSFAQPRQQASDGFQAWGSVLSNPSVPDRGDGQTRLSFGMPSIINP